MKKLLFTLVALINLTGCGNSEKNSVPSGSFSILLQLPAAIAKHSDKYESFLKTVDYLEIKLSTRSGTRKYQYPPEKWEQIQLTELPERQKNDEPIQVDVEVWDHREDGFKRGYPVLRGHGTVRGVELTQGPTLPIRIVLHAQGNGS